MGWITPIAFLLCHTYTIGDASTLETFSSKSVLSPERGALTGHFRKYLGFACRAILHTFSASASVTTPQIPSTHGKQLTSNQGERSIGNNILDIPHHSLFLLSWS